MRKIKIAIVDSGLNYNHPAFLNSKTDLVYDGEQTEPDEFYGHGTAIFNIIRRVEDIAEITNFKLDNVEEGIYEDTLVDMLEKIRDEYCFDIINLSLGISICEDIDTLYSICKDLTEAGTVIISAFDNSGSISYPAAFENVIGVTTGQSCSRIHDFEYINDNVVNLGAKGDIQRLAWNNPDYIMLGGNSFSCAHVTVQTAKFMIEGKKTHNDIMKAFKEVAKTEYDNNNKCISNDNNSLPFSIKKAVLFPFNKEMHSLIRFSDDLNFEIVGVYDSKYSANVGSTTNHIMKSKEKCLTIQNINKIQWSTFDTLILGHLDEMSGLINKNNLKMDLIKLAIKHDKNIYAFDDISSLTSSPKVYSPKIGKENLPAQRFGKLFRFSKPIIGVYGTSSRQGKFTLQLELRKRFQKSGYTVGQIGTEPSALLYGMDYVYPMGYNNSVYIENYDAIRYINNLIHNLCKKKEIDIIITGSQSGVIPFDTGNLSQYSLPQFNYLLGTQPDAVVLCINPFDELDYILRTKTFIESSVDCTVVALIMFPMDIKDDWTGIYGQREKLSEEKHLELCSAIRDKYSLPVYRLGNDEDMNLLLENIIDFFAED